MKNGFLNSMSNSFNCSLSLFLSLSQNMHSSFFIPSTYFWSSSNLLSNYRFAFHAFIVKDDKKFSGSKGDIHFYYYIVSISSLFDHDTVMSYVNCIKSVFILIDILKDNQYEMFRIIYLIKLWSITCNVNMIFNNLIWIVYHTSIAS